MIIDSLMDILSSNHEEEEKKEALFKFLEDIEIAKYLRFEEITSAQEKEKTERAKDKMNNLNKDVIEIASEMTVDYQDRAWPSEMMFDWETCVDYTEMINLKEIIDKMEKEGFFFFIIFFSNNKMIFILNSFLIRQQI